MYLVSTETDTCKQIKKKKKNSAHVPIPSPSPGVEDEKKNSKLQTNWQRKNRDTEEGTIYATDGFKPRFRPQQKLVIDWEREGRPGRDSLAV